jgi:hypothetical protein
LRPKNALVTALFDSAALSAAVEVIRDDNLHPPKDNQSRHVNGFAVLTPAQKHELVNRIAAALDADGSGNKAPGDQLLAQLAQQFAYLDNRSLDGVRV